MSAAITHRHTSTTRTAHVPLQRRRLQMEQIGTQFVDQLSLLRELAQEQLAQLVDATLMGFNIHTINNK